jgi:CheY-like chemotaxis protein
MKLKGTRVLIIEDDPIVAMAANGMVKELGGVVAGTASSVAAGEEKIRKTEFDCVMLDLNLRGEMSLGIAAELEARKMPYVFCTAYSQTFDGFEHVPRVIKPYGINSLAAGLGEAISRKNERSPGQPQESGWASSDHLSDGGVDVGKVVRLDEHRRPRETRH